MNFFTRPIESSKAHTCYVALVAVAYWLFAACNMLAFVSVAERLDLEWYFFFPALFTWLFAAVKCADYYIKDTFLNR